MEWHYRIWYRFGYTAVAQKVKDYAIKTGTSSFESEAQVAAQTDIAIPSFNKVVAGINSTNPKVSVATSNVYSSMARDHGNALTGVDAK